MKARNYLKHLNNSPAISSNDLLDLYLKALAKAKKKAQEEGNEAILDLLQNIQEEVERNMDGFLFNPYTSKPERERWYFINRVLDSSKEKEEEKEDNVSYMEHLLGEGEE